MKEITINSNTSDSKVKKCKYCMSQTIDILRKMSLFEIKTGIFHRSRQDFVPKSVSVISIIVFIFTIIKIFQAFKSYNHV